MCFLSKEKKIFHFLPILTDVNFATNSTIYYERFNFKKATKSFFIITNSVLNNAIWQKNGKTVTTKYSSVAKNKLPELLKV